MDGEGGKKKQRRKPRRGKRQTAYKKKRICTVPVSLDTVPGRTLTTIYTPATCCSVCFCFFIFFLYLYAFFCFYIFVFFGFLCFLLFSPFAFSLTHRRRKPCKILAIVKLRAITMETKQKKGSYVAVQANRSAANGVES